LLQIKYSENVEQKMRSFFNTLNEKNRRQYAGIEAIKLGHGGQKYISGVLGCHPQTVKAGIDEIVNGTEIPEESIRKPGGGRKKIIEMEDNIDEVFFEILNRHTAGSPIDAEIKWTNLSLKEISEAFESKGMNISPHVVKQLLKKHGFVERKMQKAVTMKTCQDRNEQFEKINELIDEYSKSKNPIISIDAKKRIHRQFLP
jgi:hypothetical protein